MSEYVSNILTLVEISDGQAAEGYYLKKDFSYISKFLDGQNYKYSPNSLAFQIETAEGVVEDLTEEKIKVNINILDNEYKITTITPDLLITGYINYQFPTTEILALDIEIVDSDTGEKLLVEAVDIFDATINDAAKLFLNTDNIQGIVGSTSMTFDKDGLTIKNGHLEIINGDNESVLLIDELTNVASFSGKIKANTGEIGGWIIGTDELYSENDAHQHITGMYSGSEKTYMESPFRFYAGYDNTAPSNYNFLVTENGALYSSTADITGKIVANSGKINGEFHIGNEQDGIVIKADDSGQYFMGTSQYVSGQFGHGWRLDQNGNAEFTNINARGKISSAVFEYNKISAVGGSIYVAPTIYVETDSYEMKKNEKNQLTVSFTVPQSWKSVGGREWQIGEIVKINGKIDTSPIQEFSNIQGEIETIYWPTTESYTSFTIVLQNISNIDDFVGYKILAGFSVILYGSKTAYQALYLTAVENNGPYLDVFEKSIGTIEENDYISRIRLGNLTGIIDSHFPEKKLSGYGLYGNNVYLRGKLALPNAGITDQDSIKKEDSPIRIWAGIDNTSSDTIDKANFIVTQDGSLYANKGHFRGVVEATNGEFSGIIKAAGIIIDNPGTPYEEESQHSNFYVAYKSASNRPEDYILNINSEGLSIWEGNLRVYSDAAEDNLNAYYKQSETMQNIGQTLPYLYLIDEENLKNKNLNSRIVVNKAHFFSIQQDLDGNSMGNSIVLNNGIWFRNFSNNLNTDPFSLEKEYYNKSEESKTTGLFLYDDDIFKIINGNNSSIELEPNQISFKGQINIKESSEGKVFLSLKEIKDLEGNNIGVDFIVS